MTNIQTNELATDMMARVNKERVAHGLPQNAATTAQRHVKDQSKSDFMSNTGTSTPEKRVADGGYKWKVLRRAVT
ncbi:hypothetical protein DD238_008409 [Peronospora effusa]|uniref:SCP domain-containing protein n=1 Tax=Peronospora effusa TaxID=542832 RepID=A0A3M6VMF8_9STRA|nr:hypothetical protein DD238_008409 [Peronospora effusa]RQM10702.1 hypothetical protein DD237_002261 [Peronospora effusa]